MCEVVLIAYVYAAVAVTVLRVLLFVLHVLCILGDCEGERATTLLVWGMEEVWLW